MTIQLSERQKKVEELVNTFYEQVNDFCAELAVKKEGEFLGPELLLAVAAANARLSDGLFQLAIGEKDTAELLYARADRIGTKSNPDTGGAKYDKRS